MSTKINPVICNIIKYYKLHKYYQMNAFRSYLRIGGRQIQFQIFVDYEELSFAEVWLVDCIGKQFVEFTCNQ